MRLQLSPVRLTLLQPKIIKLVRHTSMIPMANIPILMLKHGPHIMPKEEPIRRVPSISTVSRESRNQPVLPLQQTRRRQRQHLPHSRPSRFNRCSQPPMSNNNLWLLISLQQA